jgi:hypothetical protein
MFLKILKRLPAGMLPGGPVKERMSEVELVGEVVAPPQTAASGPPWMQK